MPGPTDPNDPTYKGVKYASGNPRYVWSGGRWNALNDAAPTAANDPSNTTKVTAESRGPIDLDTLLPMLQSGDYIGAAHAVADPFYSGIEEGLNNALNEGFGPTRIAPNAPGAQLNTTDADADRARLAPLLAQLRDQQATGGGAWEDSLQRATQNTQNQAQALGQSQAGMGAATAARNIGNAQAGAAQRSAGQAEILRSNAQNGATAQINALQSSMGAQDAGQAATVANVNQGVRQTNNALLEQAQQNGIKTLQGVGQGVSMVAGLSDGGPVPGRPKVFGDDEANDTVPAMLSPGEIVIPRSHASSPESAARFVRALQAKQGVAHFDGGGQVTGLEQGTVTDLFRGPQQEEATIDNGGLLDTATYDTTRQAALDNAGQYAPGMPRDESNAAALAAGFPQGYIDARNAAAGVPLQAPQYEQNAARATAQRLMNTGDANLAQGLAAPQRGGGAASGDILQRVVTGTQGAAGNAAEEALGATNQGGQAFANAILAQRARDQQMALAKRDAAFRNTQLNAGVSLNNQSLMRNIIGGGAQGFAALSRLGDGERLSTDRQDFGVADNDKAAIDSAFDSDPGDWNVGGGDIQYAAKGGVIGEGFAGAVARRGSPRRMADGGPVFETGGQGGPVAALGRLWDWAKPAPGTRIDGNTGRISVDPAALPQHSTPYPPAQPPPAPLISDEEAAALMGAGPTFLPPKNNSTPAPATPAPPPVAPAPVAPQATVAPKPASQAPVRAAAAPAPNYFQQEAAATKAVGEAEAQEARDTASILAQQQQAMETAAIDAKERQDAARAQADASFSEIQKARDEMKNVDVNVDSGRWWATRSTPQKIAGVIGLVLGAFGAGNDGVNRAAGMINSAIDRDLESQKAEHEFRMKKGQAAIDSATSLYGLHRQQSQDDATADAAAQGTALALVQNQIAQAKARSSSPQAKANADLLMAKIGERGQAADAEAKQRLFDNHIKQQHADTERMQAEAAANKPHAGDQKSQEALTEIDSRAANMRTSLAKAKAIIQKYGTMEMTGPAQAELTKALTDYAIDGAKLKDPGSVARESEVEAELKSLGVVPGIKGALTSNKTALELLDSASRDIESRVSTAHKVRGIAAKPAAAAPDKTSLADWAKKNPNDPRAAKVLERLGASP